MDTRSIAVIVAAFLSLPGTPSAAASLQVSPVNIAVQAPGEATTLTLRNTDKRPLSAQIRVFRWSMINGAQTLEPTEDVVASPPITTLAPESDYTVRLVRVTKRPVMAEESYRLLVDELPDPARQQKSTVTFVLRYSIPVFFYAANVADPNLAWSVEHRKGRLLVSAHNSGDRHQRISDLKVQSDNGKLISFGAGLTGYVLGRSTTTWSAPGTNTQLSAKGSVVISALGEYGRINAVASQKPPH
jgi:fimbrial chaperone protein